VRPAILQRAMTDSVRVFAFYIFATAMAWYLIRQCRKPTGWLGRFIVWTMNSSHSDLTSWGLEHVQVGKRDAVLDAGCGGGRTVQKLAEIADLGKVHGVDYAEASVAASRGFNRGAVKSGRVEIQRASVSRLPFPDDVFDLVTAVETHYYWPDRPGDMREIYRVLKPSGSVLIIAEVYRGRRFDLLYRLAMKLIGGAYLSPDDHRDLFVNAGYTDTQVFLEPGKGWICATGRKPR
jgi:SAM-dependent methyltransferase